jgi:hypothetical protein
LGEKEEVFLLNEMWMFEQREVEMASAGLREEGMPD